MINMMYLVLTAAGAERIRRSPDSFVTVNNGLENTKATLKEKMDETYGTFAQYASENQAKVRDLLCRGAGDPGPPLPS